MQQRLGAQDFENLLGVRLPVGGAVQVTAGLEARGELGNQRPLNQAALVVLFLVPRVGKEDVRTVQAGGRQHVVNHFDGVVLQDADVGQRLLVDALEQRADAGRVDFAAEEIFLGQQRGDVRGGLAHAKADFEHRGRAAAVSGFKIQRRGGVGQ